MCTTERLGGPGHKAKPGIVTIARSLLGGGGGVPQPSPNKILLSLIML